MNKISDTESRALGYQNGIANGDALAVGNTTLAEYTKIREGYNEGDCQIMDLCPNPLSGELAGESIPEIFNLNVGENWPDEETLTEYEQGFQEGFWDKVIKNCNYHIGDNQ